MKKVKDKPKTVEEVVVEQPKVEEVPVKEEPKAEEVAPVATEEPKVEEPKTEEPKAEEVKPEEPKAEEVKPEEPVVETPAEEPKEEKSEQPQVVKIDTSAFESVLSKVAERLEKVSKRLSKVSKSLKTPAEGASVEDQPKVEVEKVEAPKEEVKTEKSDTSSEDVSKAVLAELNVIKNRLSALEKLPAPSKIIMSKSYLLGDEDPKGGIEKVEKRLAELEEIRKTSPMNFTVELQNEAFTLINKRNALNG